MDEPAQPVLDDPVIEDPAIAAARWTAALPPPPFVNPAGGLGTGRFAPLSPRVAILITTAVVLGVVLSMAADSVRPFIVGLLFVYLLDPPVRWLVRLRVPRSLAILIVYVVAIVLIVEFLALTLTPLLNEILRFIADLPTLIDDLDTQLQRLGEFYARLQIPDSVRDWIDGLLASIGQEGAIGAGAIDLSFLLPLLTGATSLIGLVFGYLILPVWVAYLLKDRVVLLAAFDRAVPGSWRFDVWAVIRTIERVFGQWVRGQLILGLSVGVLTFVGLIIASQLIDPIFGRYAILLSVIAGVLELLPIIGPIIAAIPAVLLAATAGPGVIVAALVLYTLIQQVENNFLVPKIQGDAVELHPAVVMFAIIVGGSLAGLLGAILALPMTAAFRDVVRYLFRRLSPDEPEALAVSLRNIGMNPDDV
ncbi:MAG: AI-2E family transporter [Candidatus Limnocylindrales bacterium]|nr:AI-2E family transporter [Candidatus Limnocylindrales bacterium]